MSEDDDLASLMRWRTDGPIPGAFRDRLTADPLVARAARALAVNILAADGADQVLDGIFKDSGRYVAAWSHAVAEVESRPQTLA